MKWQPIATAPLKTEVLVFAPDEKPPVFAATGDRDLVRSNWTRSSANIRALNDDYFGDPPFEPTHWMPLPDPPTGKMRSK